MLKAFRLLLGISILFSFSLMAQAASFPEHRIIREPISLEKYRGRWILISYWATWCGYCMNEIPHLNAFYRAHRDKVAMFGVNYQDGSAEALSEHIRQSGVMFPTLAYDPRPYLPVRVHINGLPAAILIGPDGRFKRLLTGSQTKQSLERAMGL
jgi:thiol-disulfide isomerase/thioredoxin